MGVAVDVFKHDGTYLHHQTHPRIVEIASAQVHAVAFFKQLTQPKIQADERYEVRSFRLVLQQ